VAAPMAAPNPKKDFPTMATRRDILTESLVLALPDGGRMAAHLARPRAAAATRGVVVMPELFGLSMHAREICDRLAMAGFTALAPDMHHRVAPGIELPDEEPGRQRGFQLIEHLTRGGVIADARAAVDHLRAMGSARVGLLGVSLGGHMAWLAASELDVAATAALYGGWLTVTDIPLSRPEPSITLAPRLHGRVIYFVGEQDHAIGAEQRQAIAAALAQSGDRHAFVAYPGVRHGFVNERRDTFDEAAAADAWRRILGLFEAEL